MTLPFRLLVITDWSFTDLLSRLDAVLSSGLPLAVQHRHPGVSDAQFYGEALAVAQHCSRFGAPLFINRRLDVALALGAHLHLPAHGLSPHSVRPFLAGRWLSVAVHDAAEAAEASSAADLALVSPVYAPGSKPHDTRPTLGPAGFHSLASRIQCPSFALGGMTAPRVETLRPLAGVAVVSGVLGSADPARAASDLLSALPT